MSDNHEHNSSNHRVNPARTCDECGRLTPMKIKKQVERAYLRAIKVLMYNAEKKVINQETLMKIKKAREDIFR